MKTEKNQKMFRPGDWVATTEIEPRPGQKYTNAYVQKVLKKGDNLLVTYGSYMSEAVIKAKSCKLIKRG